MKTIDLERTLQMHLEEDEKLIKFVLITFHKIWNIFIGIEAYFVALFVTYILAFNRSTPGIYIWILISDLFYLTDFIATIVYINSARMQRFLPYKPKNWKYIVLDIISLIPFAFAYETYISSAYKSSLIQHTLLQNRCLRIYRVFELLSMYDLTSRDMAQYLFLVLIRFAAHAVLLSHVLTCVWVNIPQSLPCEGDHYFCIVWYESNMLVMLTHNWSGTFLMFSSTYERMLVIVTILSGILLVYGDFIPYILSIYMRVTRARGNYFQNYLKLERYLKNISVDADLNDKIQKYYRHFWASGTTLIEMESSMKELPLALRKEIFADMYWDAFRHSDLFRDVSRSCKRSLSLAMITEYCQEGDVVCAKGKVKNKMIYLVQGILELMAEENEDSPIMSFSSGTIIGEMSLFVLLKSNGIVKCRTLCEIQTLSLRNVHKVLFNYPKDKSLVFQKLNKRMVIAKITQWRKRQIMIEKEMGLDIGGGQVTVEDNEDCVKWVKTQWRAIWEAHERHTLIIKAIEEGLRIPAWRKQHEIQFRLDAVSNYMDLMVLSDVFEEKKDVVCLKTVFPWAIDPKAEFLIYWRIVVIFVAILASTVYPFCCGWLDEFPNVIFTVSTACSLIFQVDLALLLMTAVKTKHGIITKFSSILIHRLKQPTFYMDILAALPFQMYVALVGEDGSPGSNRIGLLLLPCVLKSHVFLKPRTSIGNSMVVISLIKNIFLFLLLIYWYAATFQLVCIRCVPYCNLFDWKITNHIYEDEFLRKNLLSLFVALSSSLSLSDTIVKTKNVYFLTVLSLCNILFFFWSCFFVGDFYTVYSIKITNKLKFRIMYNRILKYLESTHIQSMFEKRIIRIVRFQWTYNKADDLLTKTPMISLAPQSLRREIYGGSIYHTFKICPLFEYESNDFIFDVLDKCNLIAVPAGTLLVNYGMQCYTLYMLHKGYCQINSFLKKDVSGGLGSPLLIKPGHVFPTLGAFIAAPVPISVLSLTDCEIVVVPVEDLLKIMISHDIFRDLVYVLHTNNYREKLSHHMLAMIKVNVQYNAPADKRDEYETPFRKFGSFGKVLKHLMLHKNIFYDQNQQKKRFLKIVRVSYIAYLIITALLWPFCFGLLIFQSYFLVPTLGASKIIPAVYMYIQFHVPYFDKRGLLITHPLYTAYNYITSAFLFDVIIHFPYYTIYTFLIKSTEGQDNRLIVLFLIIQKLLSIIRIYTFFDDLARETNYELMIRPVKFILILSIVVNGAVNYEMFSSAELIYSGKHRVISFNPSKKHNINMCRELKENDVAGSYVASTFWLFGHFTTNNIFCDNGSWQEDLYALLCSLLGTFVSLIFYGWIASHSDVHDSLATIYQEHMKSFLEFLLKSKTEDKIVENSIGYFEHQWSRSRGQNLKEICDSLPYHLHEELAYPLYRPTLSKSGLFSNADEGLYRLLSTQLELVHFNRGSIIFFKGQVQSDVFFIHRGKCFVFDWFLTLEVGSMIGDINHTGLVVNKVYALTHVELLRVDSNTFFRILNNFYEVEKAFTKRATESENFIKSAYIPASQLRPVDSKDVLNAFNLQSKDLGFEDQSYFEDPENITTQSQMVSKQSVRRKKRKTFTIYPGTYQMLIYNVMYLSVAFLTIILLPHFFFFGSVTWYAFAIIGTLDVLWVIITIITFRIGVEDKIKGDIITDPRYIFKSFIRRWDGFFLCIISCIPFELVPIFLAESPEKADRRLVAWLRSLRLIRAYYLIKYLHTEENKLKVSSAVRYLSIVIYLILYIHLLLLCYYIIGSSEQVINAMSSTNLGVPQFQAILLIYEYVLNLLMSTNLAVIKQKTELEMIYFNIAALLSICVRGLVIKNMLSLKYIYSLAKTKYNDEVTTLESYLKRHEISPSILKETLDYKLNLLLTTRSENMPTFLLNAPTCLQLAIMNDLYLARLLNTPIFHEVDVNFLRLLVCRLKRELYFPGQKIVEKGDVDNTMYFIHKGEVYVIDQTNDDAYIEFVIDRIFSGDQFGEVQGLSMAKPHTNTYRARTVVEMLTLNSADWFDLKKGYPHMHQKIVQTAKKLQYE